MHSICKLQFSDNVMQAITKDGEMQEKAISNIHEQMKLLDEGLMRFYPNGTSGISNETLGLLDIVGGSVFCPFKASEQVLGLKFIDPQKTPLVYSWVETLRGLSLLKETEPPHDKQVQIISYFRQISINPPPA